MKKLVRIKTSNLIHSRIREATREATYRLDLLSSIKTGKHRKIPYKSWVVRIFK